MLLSLLPSVVCLGFAFLCFSLTQILLVVVMVMILLSVSLLQNKKVTFAHMGLISPGLEFQIILAEFQIILADVPHYFYCTTTTYYFKALTD